MINITMGLSLSAVYLITLNRLLGALYPFWYRSSVTQRKFVGVVITVSFVVTTIFTAANEMVTLEYGLKSMIGLVIQAVEYFIYFVLCICSYIIILKKIVESRRDTQANMDDEQSNSGSYIFIWNELRKGGFVIPLFITLTYLLLVIIPLLTGGVLLFLDYEAFRNWYSYWRVLYYLNNISEVLI